MGTLGKALGGFGAFVAGPRLLTEWLLQRARGFVFTTALPVAVVAWAEAAVELVASPEGDSLRDRLLARSRELQCGLAALGLGGAPPSHILPIVLGDAARTMALSEALLDHGIFVQGIRPPTVPENTSRLRFAVMATHRPEHIERALAALATVSARFNIAMHQ
jgi:7-keto-8-aminopelargonate synthetase-like enzyme